MNWSSVLSFSLVSDKLTFFPACLPRCMTTITTSLMQGTPTTFIERSVEVGDILLQHKWPQNSNVHVSHVRDSLSSRPEAHRADFRDSAYQKFDLSSFLFRRCIDLRDVNDDEFFEALKHSPFLGSSIWRIPRDLSRVLPRSQTS